MNDITPAPRKSHGTIVVILVILIILIAGIAMSMHQSNPPITPTEQAPATTTPDQTQAPSPDAQVQNIDSLNANLDNQQFEGTSDSMQ